MIWMRVWVWKNQPNFQFIMKLQLYKSYSFKISIQSTVNCNWSAKRLEIDGISLYNTLQTRLCLLKEYIIDNNDNSLLCIIPTVIKFPIMM